MPLARPSLSEVVGRLRKSYGKPTRLPTSDAFELVLLENVAYLATPERRRQAFQVLRKSVGTSPAKLAKASRAALEGVAAGGILRSASAEKLRECARIALEEFDGNLDRALDGPVAAAKKALRRFPSIGEPGAEKILLFSGRHPFLAPDSNGLRVLIRLGLVREGKSYARSYAESRAVAGTLPARIEVLQEAHLLLQQHGQTLCRRNDPLCESCPLRRLCAYAADRLPGDRARSTRGRPAPGPS